ncbi:MAG: AsmA-like C-terminal domain-containing protein, partial [Hyphomicrobiales bacterium]
RMAFEGPMVDAYLVPVVDVMSLDSVVSCLTSEKSQISGNFNLDGALQVRARREEIAKALSGRITFVSDEGTIRQSLFFAKLLALLNLTEIYRGQLPDMTTQGLDYKRTAATLEIKDGKIVVPDWYINGRTLWMGSRGEIDIATQNIDFTLMVSPFKTIDRIINAIPGIRWILGGRLVAIPMKATGTIEDPQIVPLSPSAVGTSILEMIERTLMLPIEIIQPLVPGMEQQDGGTITR